MGLLGDRGVVSGEDEEDEEDEDEDEEDEEVNEQWLLLLISPISLICLISPISLICLIPTPPFPDWLDTANEYYAMSQGFQNS